MKLKFIDYPIFIEYSMYEDLKAKLTKELISLNSVLSIYQMGSVKDPGISDLDIICVFKNGTSCDEDLRVELNNNEKNILTHGLFGIEAQDVITSFNNNLIFNLKHLGGKDLHIPELKVTPEINTQIALEYLIKLFITLDTQLKFKVVKLRAFLLLAKAVKFDLELLNINEGEFFNIVEEVFVIRKNWFKNQPTKAELSKFVLDFYNSLKLFLEVQLQKHELVLPETQMKLPGNFLINQSKYFAVKYRGVVLPNQLSFIGNKFISLQYRLNNFIYHVPFCLPEENGYHFERFKNAKKMVIKNKTFYPHFIPLTTSLSIY